ncbi:TRAP transporter substrate-binding protein DctP [Pelagibacterium montanilacus]|uniref:TRAP transporter substrate-binding protein DctP n=1 Tax=Pelagibacterium montanilacus TaxID=2185280 RepID=UPI000F8F5AA3|nr:TRAP transporter substrate-binding protein DctP [Pelagibacterium montanilacus]
MTFISTKGVLVGVLAAGISATAFSAASAQETLRMVGAWALGFSPTGEIGQNFMDNVNRLGEGVVQIEYLGADDVLPPFDQPEALVNGVFDVWYGAPNYWAGVVPGGDITELSPHPVPDGGPGSELYDFIVGLYEARGVRHIGHAAGDIGVGVHYFSTNFPVTSIDDLEGRQMRVTPLTRHIVQAAGGESVTLPPSEVYLAMDRGTVDGFSWPVADGFTRYGWQDVTDYMIDQPMYRSGGSIAMNLDRWNGLSEEAQDILLQAMAETQEWTPGWFAQNLEEQTTLMQEAGMEILTLSEEEAERWNTVAVDSLWAYYETIFDAEQIAEVRALFDAAE